MFCREHAVQLHRQKDAIAGAGADLVVVGNGKPRFIAGFREHTGFDGTIFTDPSLAAYRAAGLKRSAWRTLGPRAAVNAVRTLIRGHRQGGIFGDPYQQGGLLVILPPGRVVYHHVSEAAGDNAAPDDAVSAVVEASAAG